VSANWVDLVLVLLVALIVIIETRRGFGKALFDLAAAVLTLKLVSFAYNDASASYQIIQNTAANNALVYAAMLLAAGAACWFAGKLIYEHTLVSLEMFDPVLGMVLGVGVGIIAGHAFTNTLAIMGSAGGLSEVLTKSLLGSEFHDFRTYRMVLSTLTRLAV